MPELIAYIMDNLGALLDEVDFYLYYNFGLQFHQDYMAFMIAFFTFLSFFVLSLIIVWAFYKCIKFFFNLVVGRLF